MIFQMLTFEYRYSLKIICRNIFYENKVGLCNMNMLLAFSSCNKGNNKIKSQKFYPMSLEKNKLFITFRHVKSLPVLVTDGKYLETTPVGKFS